MVTDLCLSQELTPLSPSNHFGSGQRLGPSLDTCFGDGITAHLLLRHLMIELVGESRALIVLIPAVHISRPCQEELQTSKLSAQFVDGACLALEYASGVRSELDFAHVKALQEERSIVLVFRLSQHVAQSVQI